MNLIIELLIAIFVEWLFLLPSKFIAISRGEKFTFKSFTAKDYFIAMAFWAFIILIVFKIF